MFSGPLSVTTAGTLPTTSPPSVRTGRCPNGVTNASPLTTSSPTVLTETRWRSRRADRVTATTTTAVPNMASTAQIPWSERPEYQVYDVTVTSLPLPPSRLTSCAFFFPVPAPPPTATSTTTIIHVLNRWHIPVPMMDADHGKMDAVRRHVERGPFLSLIPSLVFLPFPHALRLIVGARESERKKKYACMKHAFSACIYLSAPASLTQQYDVIPHERPTSTSLAL
ncbi:hypothetical protein C0Q70_10802 [Pomacea canaliculata]|uniref:Uncharacterized protein n=1 Tax=Pomacea canaliculata TaxID=400727 RepID=A0A2T7P463_POMCA|nr:hypothetical protein C0Q70_10802 [Pomacea canaliculata]